MLVDLHQQFDILSLGEAGFQLAVVDALASNADHYWIVIIAFFTSCSNPGHKLEQLKARQISADKENDYHKFLFKELDDAGLKENEFEEAEILLKRQGHSEAIKTVLTRNTC